MTVELDINWDGDAPGLREHRLSISAFGPPLAALLQALRRIASNQLTEAAADPEGERGAAGGRLHKIAGTLDLEIVGLKAGSLGVEAVCTVRAPFGATLPQFDADRIDALAVDAVEELLASIAAETQGHPRSLMVRKYLGVLPHGVRKQKYELRRNGTSLRTVEVSDYELPAVSQGLPELLRVVGRVAGVGFEPGRLEVRLLGSDDKATICGATEAQVEEALRLRHEPIEALAVVEERARLLWIRGQNQPPIFATEEERRASIFTRWDETLRRLAK